MALFVEVEKWKYKVTCSCQMYWSNCERWSNCTGVTVSVQCQCAVVNPEVWKIWTRWDSCWKINTRHVLMLVLICDCLVACMHFGILCYMEIQPVEPLPHSTGDLDEILILDAVSTSLHIPPVSVWVPIACASRNAHPNMCGLVV